MVRSTDGTLPGLPGNLRSAYEGNDPARLPVFMAHRWHEHVNAEATDRLQQAALEEQRQKEAAFHRLLGLDASGDDGLALALGRAIDGSLLACRCSLQLRTRPMGDGRRGFRLELCDAPVASPSPTGASGAPVETLKQIDLPSREEARAVMTAVHQVLAAAGCPVDADEQLFHLEGSGLVALMAILERLALPRSGSEDLDP